MPPTEADVDPRIAGALLPGERIIWSGGPTVLSLRGPVLTSSILIGLGLIVARPWGQVGASPSWAAVGFGALVVLMGIRHLVRSRWVALDVAQIGYFLTDHRVLIATPERGGVWQVKALGPTEIDGMFSTEGADGLGNVIFRPAVPPSAYRPRFLRVEHGFFEVASVRAVDHLIRSTLLPESGPDPLPGSSEVDPAGLEHAMPEAGHSI